MSNQVRMSGAMFRRYREDRKIYLKALQLVYCGESVQLRTPNGKLIVVRATQGDSGGGRPRPKMMLCTVDTGEAVRPATPEEIQLAQAQKPNRNPSDPILGKITWNKRAYYVRLVDPEQEKPEEPAESPEPLQEGAIADDEKHDSVIELEPEEPVSREEEVASLRARLAELEAVEP